MVDKPLMFAEPVTSVTVHHRNAPWYMSKGYKIPESKYYPGRPSTGYELEVKTEDIHPGSLIRVPLICEECGEVYFNRWREYLAKKSNTCRACLNHPDNCHSHDFWLKRLVIDKDAAACDVCGELDKRFLVLHHLVPRSCGGANEESNYVVLCANHHEAFHRECGGTRKKTNAAEYEAYKTKENE